MFVCAVYGFIDQEHWELRSRTLKLFSNFNSIHKNGIELELLYPPKPTKYSGLLLLLHLRLENLNLLEIEQKLCKRKDFIENSALFLSLVALITIVVITLLNL